MLERRIGLAILILGTAAWAAAAAQQTVPPAPPASVPPAAPPAPAVFPATPVPPPDNVVFVAGGGPIMPLGGPVDIVAGEGAIMGKVVTGKPYSARSATESIQILADGNRIVNRNDARVYRDTAGRTRREQTVRAFGMWQAGHEPLTMVTINDPVANTTYFLNPADHTARQLQPFTFATSAAVDSAPPPLPPLPEAGSGPRVFLRTFRGPGVSAGAGGAAESVTSEDLGDQVLQGVTAHGTRQTRTIPAGAVGNERAIDVVSEQWYSPDLEAVVLRRTSDPRFGETTYELVDVQRSEPAPDLFTVPQDYALVRDDPPPVGAEFGAAPAGAVMRGARAERRVFLVQPAPARQRD